MKSLHQILEESLKDINLLPVLDAAKVAFKKGSPEKPDSNPAFKKLVKGLDADGKKLVRKNWIRAYRDAEKEAALIKARTSFP